MWRTGAGAPRSAAGIGMAGGTAGAGSSDGTERCVTAELSRVLAFAGKMAGGEVTMTVRGADHSAVKEKDGMCSATSAGMASARMRTAVQARLARRAWWTRSTRSRMATVRARASDRTADSPRTWMTLISLSPL